MDQTSLQLMEEKMLIKKCQEGLKDNQVHSQTLLSKITFRVDKLERGDFNNFFASDLKSTISRNGESFYQ